MKRLLIGLVIIGMSACVAPAFGENEAVLADLGISVSGDVSYYSEYIWRGILLDGDPVIQPGVYVAGPDSKLGKFTAKVWSNHDLSNADSRKSEEYDYIIDYTYTLDSIGISAGHTYYDYPETDTSSREFYAGLTLSKVMFAPSIFVFRDYGKPEDGGGEGTYIVLNAAYSIPVKLAGYAASVDFVGHYGCNHELFIAGKGADAGLFAGLTIPLTKNSTLTPSVNYSVPFGDLKKASDGNQKSRVYTGVTLKYSF